MSTNEEDPTSITPLFKTEQSPEPEDSGVIVTQPEKIVQEEENRKANVFENRTPQKPYSDAVASWFQCCECWVQCCDYWVFFLPWLVTGCNGGCVECLDSTCECFSECLPLCGECCVSVCECCR